MTSCENGGYKPARGEIVFGVSAAFSVNKRESSPGCIQVPLACPDGFECLPFARSWDYSIGIPGAEMVFHRLALERLQSCLATILWAKRSVSRG